MFNNNYLLNNYLNNNLLSVNYQLNNNLIAKLSTQDFLIINSLFSEIDCQKLNNNINYLQNKILSNPNYSNEVLFPFLFPNILYLINNQYGNSIYQVFIEILNKNNTLSLLSVIKNNFNEISKNQNGTKLIQKLIEKSSLNDKDNTIQKNLINILKGKVYECSIDEFANHIIQKFIIHFNYPINNFIYKELTENFVKVCINKFGCCVIQKCLINGTKEQKEKIIYLVLKYTFHLIKNQFGNYVYQGVILLKNEKVISKIIDIISDKIISLCKEKYSSNVIEKFFDINNLNIINPLINYLTENELRIMELITNKYGNYIIQKILSVCSDKNLFLRTLNIIAKNIQTINNISFGKKLISKLKEKYPILYSLINNNN